MPAKNHRVNVTFEEYTLQFLSLLAKENHKSLSGIVKELTLEALEKREDQCLSKLAQTLDKPNVKTYSHRDAWK